MLIRSAHKPVTLFVSTVALRPSIFYGMTSRKLLLAISDKLATRTDSGQERPRLVDTDVVVHCQPLVAFLAAEIGFADFCSTSRCYPANPHFPC